MTENGRYERHLEEDALALEQELGLPRGFFKDLLGIDDWSFVIKLHAMVEAASTYLLSKNLQQPILEDVFGYLELSNKRSGKIAFITALGLLDDADRRYISSLSELRNKLVHDIRNVTYDLASDVQAMSDKEFHNFVKRFNTIDSETMKLKTGEHNYVTDLFRMDPQQGIWYSAMAVLGNIYWRALPKH